MIQYQMFSYLLWISGMSIKLQLQ